MRDIALHKEIKIVLSNRFGGVSKKPYESLNLGLHVGDNGSCVQKNRDIFASHFNLDSDSLIFMNQVHSDKVIYVKEKGKFTCDGVITQDRNLALCAMVADCVPVVLYDSKNRVSSAIHAGREGAFLNIVLKTLQKMREDFNSQSQDVFVYIGPHIKKCCYEINNEILEDAKKRFGFAVDKRGDRCFLDLEAIVLKQLNDYGVLHIKNENICTCCDNDYFSYRRDRVTGRFVVGVKIL
ncbi:MAG: peptidoglycan editing factor PgeF [Campylobacteraceae bacterium]|jgi:YfiH family protein|nr:peptidoglycan editing factor PgeF [Campylobacteraceae bacterium]